MQIEQPKPRVVAKNRTQATSGILDAFTIYVPEPIRFHPERLPELLVQAVREGSTSCGTQDDPQHAGVAGLYLLNVPGGNSRSVWAQYASRHRHNILTWR